jgi:hypothetical protein
MMPLSGTLMNKVKILESKGDPQFLEDFYKSNITTNCMKKNIDKIDYDFLEKIMNQLEGKNVV